MASELERWMAPTEMSQSGGPESQKPHLLSHKTQQKLGTSLPLRKNRYFPGI